MDDAPRLKEEPEQIPVALVTDAEGNGLTVIVTESVLVQPVAVIFSVRVYVVVTVGFTLGLLLAEVYPPGLLVQLYV